MKKLKLGQKVTVTKKYVRVLEFPNIKKWVAEEIKPIEGIVTGVRTLKDVNVYPDEWGSEPYHYKKAYYVTFSIGRNAIKVPEFAIFPKP